MNWQDYKGAIHIHSRYSDGSGSLRGIVKAANKAGLDYCIITDHHTLRHKEEGAERWHNGTLTLVGEEISPQTNHYLALGIEKAIDSEDSIAQNYIDEVNRQGGLGFIVHPDSKGKKSLGLKERPWTAWGVKNFTGLELWSYMYDWLGPVNLLNLPYYALRPDRAITGPNKETLQKWDELTRERRVVAIGSVDAHARRVIPFGIFEVFPYRQIFLTIRTHILTSLFNFDLEHDRHLVYSALRQGHSYISYDYLAVADGFKFETEDAIMGDEVELSSGLTLTASSPQTAHLKLIFNGRAVKETEDTSLKFTVRAPGVYRLEAYLKGRPWVFTNPIYVRGR